MSSNNLAVKYRPTKFEDVIGQTSIVANLKGHLKASELGNVLIFAGAHGCGKTTMARLLAMAVNCEDPDADGNPCGKCESCRSIMAGQSADVIELDAASNNKSEDTNKIVYQLQFLPRGKKKIFILDEAHMLTVAAQNNLLKSLEDTPKHVMFIFCTTEAERLADTVKSRAVTYTFQKMTSGDILERLKYVCDVEDITYEEEALNLIMRESKGHMRDALTILGKLSYEPVTADRAAMELNCIRNYEQIELLLQAILSQDLAGALMQIRELDEKGVSFKSFFKEFCSYLAMVAMVSEKIEGVDTDLKNSCLSMKEFLSDAICIEFSLIAGKAFSQKRELLTSANLCIMEMVGEVQKEARLVKLQEEVNTLRQQIEQGAISQPVVMQQSSVLKEEYSELPSEQNTSATSVMSGDSLTSSEPTDGFVPVEEDDMMPLYQEIDLNQVSCGPAIAPLPPVYEGAGSTPLTAPAQPSQSISSKPALAIPGGTIRTEEDVPVNMQPTTPVETVPEEEVPQKKDEDIKPNVNVGGFRSFGANFFGSSSSARRYF